MIGWMDDGLGGVMEGRKNISHVNIFKVAIYWSRTHSISDFTCTELHQYFHRSSFTTDIAIPANNAYYILRHMSLLDVSPFSLQLQFHLRINGTRVVGFMSLFLWRVCAILTACWVWVRFLIGPIRAWCDDANWPAITETPLIALFL
jgi:hypothetical protein